MVLPLLVLLVALALRPVLRWRYGDCCWPNRPHPPPHMPSSLA
jgi:hypothetical protein